MNFHNAFSLFVAVSATAAFAAPDVTNVQMSQNAGNCKVTITYTLSEPAVVTLDILTNATPNAAAGWASIGGEHICNAQGDVWKKIETAGTHTITWQPAESWLDEYGDGFKVADGCAKASVSAWPLDNTPDYMVVDISSAAQPNTQRYYPRVDFLPGSQVGQKGAVTNNPAYKSSLLLMRKIMAKDVTWTMGSTELEGYYRTAVGEATHQVTLTNNYYIGVFEVTQSQWNLITGSNPSSWKGEDFAAKPVNNISWANTRMSNSSNTAEFWPEPPAGSSFLGKLQTKTGLDFDLPSEAQWEFACRAGNGDTKWGDGSQILVTTRVTGDHPVDANLDNLGLYARNGGIDRTEAGPMVVGSFRPNSWGLYDMHGNVREWCLDWFQINITGYNGAVNVNLTVPTKCLDGSDPVKNSSGDKQQNRIARGGAYCYEMSDTRSARRTSGLYSSPGQYIGVRVACQAGLK